MNAAPSTPSSTSAVPTGRLHALWRLCSLLALPLWLLFSLYFGVLGFAVMDIEATIDRSVSETATTGGLEGAYVLAGTPMTFASLNDLSDYLQERALHQFGSTVGAPGAYYLGLPRSAAILLATFAFGVLGGTTRQIRDLALARRPLEQLRPFSFPLFGGLMGLVLFIITFIAPSIVMSADGAPPRANAVLALSLLGGLFADRMILFVEELLGRILRMPSMDDAPSGEREKPDGEKQEESLASGDPERPAGPQGSNGRAEEPASIASGGAP